MFEKQNEHNSNCYARYVCTPTWWIHQHVCECVVVPFILDVRLVDVPAGVTQEEGHTGFFIRLSFAALALIFLPRKIQPSLSLVDRAVELCVL